MENNLKTIFIVHIFLKIIFIFTFSLGFALSKPLLITFWNLCVNTWSRLISTEMSPKDQLYKKAVIFRVISIQLLWQAKDKTKSFRNNLFPMMLTNLKKPLLPKLSYLKDNKSFSWINNQNHSYRKVVILIINVTWK